jgi:CRISPR-associated protein Cas1
MHEGSDGSSKFILDLMEPERPRVDRAVLDFVKGHVFDPADFVIRTDGVSAPIWDSSCAEKSG